MSDERNDKQPDVQDEDLHETDEAAASVDSAAPSDDAPKAPASEEVLAAEDTTPDGTGDELEKETDPSAAADEPEDYGTMPRFLTREEYENFGDDPEPLPEGFEVIDGGQDVFSPLPADAPAPVSAPAAQTTPASNELDAAEDDEEDGPSTGEALSHAASEAASNLSSIITQGMGAVRQMSSAKRAHAEAREELEELEERIEQARAELSYRQQVVEHFPRILAEQTTRKNSAEASMKASQALQGTLQKHLDKLKKQLDDMKAADTATEKRLKVEVESTEKKEEAARDAANRMRRRLTDAQRALEKAQETRESSIASAQHAVEAAQTRLNALREEHAEIQRNPSANSAVYSVRGTQLEADIAAATEELQRATEDLPRVTEDAEATLAAAQNAVREAEKPIAEAKAAFPAIADAAGNARDALDAARKEAQARQKELKGTIAEQERDLKEQQRICEEAAQEAAEADRIIAQITDVRDHPEVTERIANALAADSAEHAELSQQVAVLADAEAKVRESTRGSRLRFIGIVAAIVVVVVLIAIIWFFVL